MKAKKSEPTEQKEGCTMELPDKELLRIDEVADFFSVTDRTIRLWLDHGHLEAERIAGKTIRITRKSVLTCRLPYKTGE
jgi:excisionase family DNA binding protein